MKITSASNAHIKYAVTLLTKAKERREEQAFVTEGLRIFLDTPAESLKEVFVSEGILRETAVITGESAGEHAGTNDGKRGRGGTRADAAARGGGNVRADAASSQRAIDLLRFSEKLAALAKQEIPVYEIPDDLMAKISDTKTPQGVLAIVKTPQYSFEELLGGTENEAASIAASGSGRGSGKLSGSGAGEPGKLSVEGTLARAPLLLILENVQDPGNLGTMLRTAEAAGVTGVLMNRGTVDITNPKTVRATMSAIFRIPFCCAEDDESFDRMLRKLKERGVKLCAAHLKGKECYDGLDYRSAAGFLIGNEGSGLTDRTAAMADSLMIIPMQGQIESLNAAMAAGILMYEAARQRRKAL